MYNKLIASDKPLVHLTEIIDINELKQLFQGYSDLTGMVTALLDLEGKVLIATNWQDSCTQFHRLNSTTSKRCHESDTALAGALEKGEKYTAYRCRNGLVDVATPVIIDGMHMANFFTGQFFYQQPDLDYFSRQADEVGFEKMAYLDAIKRVPVYDEATIQAHMAFLVRIAEMVGKVGAANLKVQRANQELEDHKNNLQALVEERTAQLNNSLKAANAANLAKTTFLTNMSHELRTPLHAVLGFAEILAAKETDPQKRQYLHSINIAGSGLLNLLNSILDLSKIEAGKMPIQTAPVSVAALASEVATIFERQATEKNLALRIHIAENVPVVLELDEARLRQILINLVSNAIKFTEAGFIEIRVQTGGLNAQTNTRTVVISVEDSGSGIHPDDQHRIFEIFEQAKGQSINEYGGTGIGLALVKQIILLLGGKLHLESRIGKGSCFTCEFPNVKVLPLDVLSNNAETDSNAGTPNFVHAAILVADDNPMNRDLLTTWLKEWDFDILQAENGEQAIAMAKQHKPDLIFMDMKMPVMDGYVATQVLKSDEHTRHIPIIAATASALSDHEKRIRSVTDDYLRKPIRRKDLLKSLRRFIATRVCDDATTNNRVLVVDDNPVNCVLLADMLEDLNHLQVTVVHSGYEAVEAACSESRPNIIFMDYQMPGLNGLEATQKIRFWEIENNVKASRIYAVTALNNEEMRNLDTEKLFDGILGKPFETEDIHQLVNQTN